MYIERTDYYTRPGRLEEVITLRRRVSDLRVQLGLPAGSIYVKHSASEEGPDVVCECHFPSLEAYQKDREACATSSEFEAISAEMRDVVHHFTRHFMRQKGGPAGDVDLRGIPIVPRRVTFPSGDYPLAGFLFLPPGDGPFPCMLFNHGSMVHQGSDDVCKPAVAATLMSWGIAAFMPHRRGYGESPGPGWRDEVPSEFGTDEYDAQLVARLDRESDDVVAALDFVHGLPEILADHVGVMGSSFGGINTLLAASKSEHFRCAVEFAGAAMNWERTPKLREYMLAAARGLTQPIFFIQAENDFSTRPTLEMAAALANTGQFVQSKVFPAFGLSNMEGHLFERNGTMIWGVEVRAFLEKWL